MSTIEEKELQAKKDFDKHGYDFDACPCPTCPDKTTCAYAYDLYNTNGDCLASK
jgi:hypothetical protein